MEKHEILLQYCVYGKESDLPEKERSLLRQAVEAAKTAYAPYSAFCVGAAILLENGEVITGSNQENAAYPSGMCAERVALYYASAKYPDVPVTTIAITAHANDFRIEEPVTPCGSCRQVMAETEMRFQKKIKLMMQADGGKIYITDGVFQILPLMFHADKLKKKSGPWN
ncbi:MAG: cytidine deaminase [Bacteroidales bacterium]